MKGWRVLVQPTGPEETMMQILPRLFQMNLLGLSRLQGGHPLSGCLLQQLSLGLVPSGAQQEVHPLAP